MDERFAGKSVLITGPTSGIGHAVASAFRGNQASVTAIGRNEVALDQLYGTDGNDVLRISADVTDIDAMRRVVEEVLGQFGRLDVLVNAAGHISSGTIETTALSAWDAMMNVKDRKSTRLNSSHVEISYAVFCLKKKKKNNEKIINSQLIN